jgi:hypothetical protein
MVNNVAVIGVANIKINYISVTFQQNAFADFKKKLKQQLYPIYNFFE